MVWELSTLPFDMYRDYLQGKASLPQQQSNVQLVGAPVGGDQGPSGEAATTTPTTQGTGTQAPSLATTSYDQQGGSIEDKLLNPLKTGLPKETSNIQAMRQAFNQEAGPSRTWEGIGGQGIFDQAISSGNVQPAKDLIGASYTGPSGLGEDYAKSDYEIENLYGRANALQSPAGLMGYVQAVDPSMTRGKARFQAGSMLGDEAFKSELPTLYGQAKEAKTYSDTQGQEAIDFAKQRTKEEADIAKSAWDYGVGERDELTKGWDEAIAGTNYDAKKKAAQDAYTQMAETGTMPTDVSVEGTKKIAESDIVKGMTDAQKQYDKIFSLRNYDAAKNIPALELTVTNHGRHYYKVPDAWANSEEGKRLMADPTWNTRFEAAIRRQQHLEKYFDPYTAQRKTARYGDGAWRDEGEFSEYMPLYYTGGQNFELSNLAPFSNVDVGFAPNRENISTDAERDQYNTILDILSQEGAIADPTQAYRDPHIDVNADRYLANEKARLKQWDEEPTEIGEQYFADVHEARKNYREALNSGYFDIALDFHSLNFPDAVQAAQRTLDQSPELAYTLWNPLSALPTQIESEFDAKRKIDNIDYSDNFKTPSSRPEKGAKSKRSVLKELQELEKSGLLR